MNVFDLNEVQQTNKYVSKEEKLKQLIESEEFRKRFNLYHGKGKRKKRR